MRVARLLFYSLIVAGAVVTLTAFPKSAVAQHHHHPAGLETQLHEKFYSTWFMPDEPTKSCCNKADCYPTEVKFQEGQWHARRREDGLYIPIPWKKVERKRDNPDGRNHVCMPPPASRHHPPNTVFCFLPGAGT
jgi:hypothetical protein